MFSNPNDKINFYVEYFAYRKRRKYTYYKYGLWIYIVIMLMTAVYYSIKNSSENKYLLLHVVFVAFNMFLQTKNFFCEIPTILNYNNPALKYVKFNDIIIKYLIQQQYQKDKNVRRNN